MSNSSMMKQFAIFLGAGASAADGSPVQSQLFRLYFELLKSRQSSDFIPNHEKEIALFFSRMFGIDFKTNDLDAIKFPTFEEALGILDLADMRNESFRDYPNINLDSDSGKIKFLRLYLVFLLAEVLNEELHRSKGIHKQLVRNLKRDFLQNTYFITTNYDILCDNALLDITNITGINYGFDFRNYNRNDFQQLDTNSPYLFKLHGSLNWLYCPTCNTVKQIPYEKGVYNLITDPNQSYCPKCHSFYSPIIVPPTFYKDMSNIYLGMVWNKTELALTYVKHIVFCGYSFPDADMHIKYLIKRIQKNRRTDNLKFTVINNYIGKSEESKKEEKDRFIRFLGNNVEYTDMDFEEFAKNPTKILKLK